MGFLHVEFGILEPWWIWFISHRYGSWSMYIYIYMVYLPDSWDSLGIFTYIYHLIYYFDGIKVGIHKRPKPGCSGLEGTNETLENKFHPDFGWIFSSMFQTWENTCFHPQKQWRTKKSPKQVMKFSIRHLLTSPKTVGETSRVDSPSISGHVSSHHPKIRSQTRRIARKRLLLPLISQKNPRTLGQFDLKVAFPDQKVRWKIPKSVDVVWNCSRTHRIHWGWYIVAYIWCIFHGINLQSYIYIGRYRKNIPYMPGSSSGVTSSWGSEAKITLKLVDRSYMTNSRINQVWSGVRNGCFFSGFSVYTLED